MGIIRFARNCDARLFAGVVLLAAGAIGGYVQKTANDGVPTNIRTVSGAVSNCAKQSVKTPFGKLGCGNVAGIRQSGSTSFLRAQTD